MVRSARLFMLVGALPTFGDAVFPLFGLVWHASVHWRTIVGDFELIFQLHGPRLSS